MPALYAHDRFGTLVTREARGDLKRIILKYNPSFRTGLQGPDPFFFYKAYGGNRVRRYGTYLHSVSAMPFFRHAVTVIRETGRDSSEYAYLLGYVCHFILDSECHPCVAESMKATGAAHLQIESEFEKYLLRMENHDPFSYPLADMIIADETVAASMDPFYPSVTRDEMLSSLRWYKFVKWLFSAKSAPRQDITNAILRLAGKYDDLKGLMHDRQDIPQCSKSNQELLRLFEQAVPLAADLIEKLDCSIQTGARLPDRFNRNFE